MATSRERSVEELLLQIAEQQERIEFLEAQVAAMLASPKYDPKASELPARLPDAARSGPRLVYQQNPPGVEPVYEVVEAAEATTKDAREPWWESWWRWIK